MHHCCLLHSEETDRRSTLDRSVLVCRRKSWEKILAGTQPHARVPSPKIRRNKLRKSIRLRAYSLSRALGPVLFTRNTRKTPKINFPDLPNGCGPRQRATSSAWKAEKTLKKNFSDFRSGHSTQIFPINVETWVGGLGRTFRIVPNLSSFCLTEADLSLLSYHVSVHTLSTC